MYCACHQATLTLLARNLALQLWLRLGLAPCSPDLLLPRRRGPARLSAPHTSSVGWLVLSAALLPDPSLQHPHLRHPRLRPPPLDLAEALRLAHEKPCRRTPNSFSAAGPFASAGRAALDLSWTCALRRAARRRDCPCLRSAGERSEPKKKISVVHHGDTRYFDYEELSLISARSPEESKEIVFVPHLGRINQGRFVALTQPRLHH